MGKTALDPIAAPSPSPSPSPTPPPIVPVTGTVEVQVVDSSDPQELGFSDDGPPAEGSVDAAAQAVSGVLDQFLDGAQRGEPDLLVLRGAWLADVDAAGAGVLRTGLTNPDAPVQAASYLLRVHAEPNPALVVALVRVDRRDGTTATAEFVFDVTGDQPRLDLVGNGKDA